MVPNFSLINLMKILMAKFDYLMWIFAMMLLLVKGNLELVFPSFLMLVVLMVLQVVEWFHLSFRI